MKCLLCNDDFYLSNGYEPPDKCLCGHKLRSESPWKYARWQGVLAVIRYQMVLPIYEYLNERIAKWIYQEFKLEQQSDKALGSQPYNHRLAVWA